VVVLASLLRKAESICAVQATGEVLQSTQTVEQTEIFRNYVINIIPNASLHLMELVSCDLAKRKSVLTLGS